MIERVRSVEGHFADWQQVESHVENTTQDRCERCIPTPPTLLDQELEKQDRLSKTPSRPGSTNEGSSIGQHHSSNGLAQTGPPPEAARVAVIRFSGCSEMTPAWICRHNPGRVSPIPCTCPRFHPDSLRPVTIQWVIASGPGPQQRSLSIYLPPLLPSVRISPPLLSSSKKYPPP